jgi:hypothetical protein
MRSLRKFGLIVLTALAVTWCLVGTGGAAFASSLTVTGLSPGSGPVGTSVTITGSGFTAVTAVDFARTSASFTIVSPTTISATVPSSATTGYVSVSTGNGAATSSAAFRVTPGITGFSPMFGPPGSQVTIDGSGFKSTAAVTFDGIRASVAYDSPQELTATVPTGAHTGYIKVRTRAGTATSSAEFTVGQVFNVADYGAIANGTGDNTPAFARAIAAAQAAGGGIVSVPAGTYDFVTGSPTSIQIDGTTPITLAGAGRGSTKLVEMTYRKDLLSIRCDGTTVQDLTFDTQTHTGGHGIGDGASDTLVQRVAVYSGTKTFGIYYMGPPGAHPGDGLYDQGNVLNDIILNDEVKSDGFSFSFQKNAAISNVVHTGSRISLYADSGVTITNYQYTPGSYGANAGWVISTPCDHITINNFVSSGQGGQIRNAPDMTRVNSYITINGEKMTGPSSSRLLIGDVENLLVENSSLEGIVISPKFIAQGTVETSTYTSVTKRPAKGATVDINFDS